MSQFATPAATPAGGAGAALTAASIRHPLARALLVLTFTTGLVDAASYLGLGRVFTANMTGNVVLLGFGVAGGLGLPVMAPLVSLGAFVVGSGAGGTLARALAHRRPQHIRAALACELSLLIVAAVLTAALTIRANEASGDVVIALLALAMGVRNATVRRLGVPDLTTTVLTMTLTGLAADSRLAGGSGEGTARRGAAAAAMLVGALVGAALVKSSVVWPLLIAAALVPVTWLVYLPAARRAGEGQAPARR